MPISGEPRLARVPLAAVLTPKIRCSSVAFCSNVIRQIPSMPSIVGRGGSAGQRQDWALLPITDPCIFFHIDVRRITRRECIELQLHLIVFLFDMGDRN